MLLQQRQKERIFIGIQHCIIRMLQQFEKKVYKSIPIYLLTNKIVPLNLQIYRYKCLFTYNLSF